jgi:23S rRNA (adenine2030-N6)-methyltransferase
MTAVGAEPASVPITRYPGSPRLARALLRPDDRLIVNEMHPEDAAALKALFARDPQTNVLTLDGYTALKSLLPPKERRGLVLVDPPFEAEGELGRLVTGLGQALHRFATGTYLVWYPIKDPRALAGFFHGLAGLNLAKAVRLEHFIRGPRDPSLLNGGGLVIVNPPFTLPDRLAAAMPYLTDTLAQGPGATWTLAPL